MKTNLPTFALALAALLPALPATGQVPDQLKHFIPAPPVGAQSGALLGRSVAVDGNYIVAGTPMTHLNDQSLGAVKVFDATTGGRLFVLPAGLASNRGFGDAVAISGTRVVVGAPALNNEGQSGSVCVYDLSSATPAVPILMLNSPAPGANDAFGKSVAIDGMRMVVGASLDDSGAVDAGRAYVYDLNSATPTSPAVTLVNPSPGVSVRFGFSVAISATRHLHLKHCR